jgi:hypothetical protein
MLTLVNILIIFFICLILYQTFLANNIIEGLENEGSSSDNTKSYQQYDTNNPDNALILSQKNAGNIEYLKDRINNVQDIFQQVQDLSGNFQTLQSQVDGLVQAQQDYTNQMTGGTAPEITGTTDTDTSLE